MKYIYVIKLLMCVSVYGTLSENVFVQNEDIIEVKENIKTKLEENFANDNVEHTKWTSIKEPFTQILGFLTNNTYGLNNFHCNHVFDYPINLPHNASIASYGKLYFSGFKSLYKGILVLQDDNLDLILKHTQQILISGGGLRGTYYLHTIRFLSPSHHTLVGARFSTEIQFICINIKYSTYSTAKMQLDGIAIFSSFVIIGSNYNQAYRQIEEGVKNLVGHPPTYEMKQLFSPASLLPKNKCSFFRYHGKLMEDPCNEIITWTIFTDPTEITLEQIIYFEDLINPRISKSPDDFVKSKRSMLQIINLINSKPNYHKIVTLQPRIYCGVPFSNIDEYPWFYYHKFYN